MRLVSVNVGLPRAVEWRGRPVRAAIFKAPVDGPCGVQPVGPHGRLGCAVRDPSPLAEACDVPADWSCRTGVCHRRESGLVDGSVAYEPEPLDAPAEGQVLLCCSRPRGPVTIDL